MRRATSPHRELDDEDLANAQFFGRLEPEVLSEWDYANKSPRCQICSRRINSGEMYRGNRYQLKTNSCIHDSCYLRAEIPMLERQVRRAEKEILRTKIEIHDLALNLAKLKRESTKLARELTGKRAEAAASRGVPLPVKGKKAAAKKAAGKD